MMTILDNHAHQNTPFNGDRQATLLCSNLFMDHVGEVLLTLNSNGLSWKSLESSENDGSNCLGFKLDPKVPNKVKFSDVYAVELISNGMINTSKLPKAGAILLGRESHDSEMCRFTVHSFQKSKTQPNLWVLAAYTFGHKDLSTCEMWVNQINASLNVEVERPKNLLIFVHPMSGKGNGRRTWETVAPIFSRAKIETTVIVTQRAGQAYDVMAANKELNSYDGVVAVGGDGFFNEILNGFLSSRYKAPYPPAPSDFHSVGNNGHPLVHDSNEIVNETSYQYEDQPLLENQQCNGSGISNIHQDPEFPLPNKRFRFGIIPAGSTDAIVICTTGARDPVTSALHIVLGKRVCLDIAQVVRWKATATSKVEPCVRYAASFAGYGFYGDVITESEKYRWMGPKRYDYAGTKVFLRHRSYEAEIAYLDVEAENTKSIPDKGHLLGRVRTLRNSNKCEKVICRRNCNICSSKSVDMCTSATRPTPYSRPEEARWLRSKGSFLSVGAAMISNRNERAPDGLVVDAHLSDGLLHLILIKDCPRAFYLWHLTELARKGGNPLNFEFVEHHKTPAFTFTSFGKQSVWNLDGELFQAHQLSAQVFKGLITLFASGPEV
ncbi:ceramide kinase-like [Melia azedarach]|uniref:Ceramide kinase-like n=1 Tax=Melia azedarach TaxID=155640 RepID=A0ACC1X5Y6_MELAZ|nr:ceramide kinase-like [Melia azedarach]